MMPDRMRPESPGANLDPMPVPGSPEQAPEAAGVEGAARNETAGSLVRLPRGARRPIRVFVNGVEQREGSDYAVERDGLRFSRSLAKEGKLGIWRWALMFFGIAGTYRRNDSVDVQYTIGGHTRLATGLEFEPASAERRPRPH
jgi:hypothetical protein